MNEAAKLIFSQVDAAAEAVLAASLESKFKGSVETLQACWALSAVLLKNGTVEVVPAGECVKVCNSTVLVHLTDGGTVEGRKHWRDLAWFQNNAEAVWLGSLTLGNDTGTAAVTTSSNGLSVEVLATSAAGSGVFSASR